MVLLPTNHAFQCCIRSADSNHHQDRVTWGIEEVLLPTRLVAKEKAKSNKIEKPGKHLKYNHQQSQALVTTMRC